ncbi:MAG: RnfABCDGE type electron transport complex subunit D [Oscillospiraceae bacterium]|nr:RnfABCDGE type electron transport complex subunit D [Oscillospiraceae bacterium]
MSDVVITLLAVLAVAVFYYGPRVLITLAVSLATAFITEFICLRLIGQKKHEKYDFSHIITALIITLLLPPAVEFWMPAVSVIVALCVAKFPFGGLGNNIFNPAAAGLAFVGLCWPELIFKYCAPGTTLSLFSTQIVEKASPLDTLAKEGTPRIDYMDALLGNFPGAAGATAVMVLAACGIYLILRRTISIEIPLTIFAASSFFAVVHQRVNTGYADSLMYETIAGTLIFGAVFMANDPSTIPHTSKGRLIFGALLGVFAMLFRYFGVNDFGFLYALLIVNALSDFCDRAGEKLAKYIKRYAERLWGFIRRNIKTLLLKLKKVVGSYIANIVRKGGER